MGKDESEMKNEEIIYCINNILNEVNGNFFILNIWKCKINFYFKYIVGFRRNREIIRNKKEKEIIS